MICKHCGKANAPGVQYCANCGTDMTAAPVRANPWVRIGMFALGLFAGLIGTAVLYVSGFAFAKVWRGAPPQTAGSNFGVYQGSAWFFFLCLPALAIALIVLWSPRGHRLEPAVRLFLTGALCVALGGMALCNLFSISFLFSKGP